MTLTALFETTKVRIAPTKKFLKVVMSFPPVVLALRLRFVGSLGSQPEFPF
jgi:hypothetical protein